MDSAELWLQVDELEKENAVLDKKLNDIFLILNNPAIIFLGEEGNILREAILKVIDVHGEE